MHVGVQSTFDPRLFLQMPSSTELLAFSLGQAKIVYMNQVKQVREKRKKREKDTEVP